MENDRRARSPGVKEAPKRIRLCPSHSSVPLQHGGALSITRVSVFVSVTSFIESPPNPDQQDEAKIGDADYTRVNETSNGGLELGFPICQISSRDRTQTNRSNQAKRPRARLAAPPCQACSTRFGTGVYTVSAQHQLLPPTTQPSRCWLADQPIDKSAILWRVFRTEIARGLGDEIRRKNWRYAESCATLEVPEDDSKPDNGGYELLPTTSHWIGQNAAIRRFKVALEASWNDGTKLPHMLFCGCPGTGKTLLANLAAKEMGVELHERIAQVVNFPGALNGLLLQAKDKEIVLLDEIHELIPPAQTLLYQSDGRRADLRPDKLRPDAEHAPEGLHDHRSDHG